MPLYAQDLNEMPCSKCGEVNCNEGDSSVILAASCHPAAGQLVSYDRRKCVLTFACEVCHQLVSRVYVADDPKRPGRN